MPPGALGHLFLGAGMLGLNASINSAAPPAASSRGSRASDPASPATPTPNAATPTKSQKASEKSSESSSRNHAPTNEPNGGSLDALLAFNADGENFLADPLSHRAGRQAEQSAGSSSESKCGEVPNTARSGPTGTSNRSAPPSQSPSSSRGVAESKRSAERDALTVALNRPETPAVRPHKESRPFRPGKGKDGDSGEGGGGGMSLMSFSNTPPVAVNDAYYVHQGQFLSVGTGDGVLENDTDDDYDYLTAELVDQASHGYVDVYSDGTFYYTPDSGYVGEDSFTYRVYDGTDYSNVATVTIYVTNQNPVAVNDTYEVHHGQFLSTGQPGVLENDTDGDSDVLVPEVVTEPSHGYLDLSSDGGVYYTPETGFVGTDSFTYRVHDGAVWSNVATVTIHVTNQNPVAVNDAFQVHQGQMLMTGNPGVLLNDTDGDGDALTVEVVDEPSHGYLSLFSDGTVDYTPATGFVGTDSFTYRIHDGAAYSNVATVMIQVLDSGVNEAPIINDQSFAVDENSLSGTVVGSVSATDPDAGQTLTYSIAAGNTDDAFAIDAATGEITVASSGAIDFETTPTFSLTVQVTDSGSPPLFASAIVMISLNNVNETPSLTAVAITSLIAEDGLANLTASLADPDAEDTFTLVVDWGDGSPLESFTYGAGTTTISEYHRYLDDNPTATASDVYTVGLTLSDALGSTATASSSITVTNVAPELRNVAASTPSPGDQTTTLVAEIVDPGTLDSFTVSIDWGDGQTEVVLYPAGTKQIQRNHQYAMLSPGGYTIGLTVEDDDGGIASDSVTVGSVYLYEVYFTGFTGAMGYPLTDAATDDLIVGAEWRDANLDGDTDDSGDRQEPGAFIRNQAFSVKAGFVLPVEIPPDTVSVWAEGGAFGGLNSAAFAVRLNSSGEGVFTINTPSDAVDLREEGAWYWTWKYRIDDDETVYTMGTSSHTLCITYDEPDAEGATYKQVLIPACLALRGFNPDGAMQQSEEDPELAKAKAAKKAADELIAKIEDVPGTNKNAMFYDASAGNSTVAQLLRTNKGDCNVWVRLFEQYRKVGLMKLAPLKRANFSIVQKTWNAAGGADNVNFENEKKWTGMMTELPGVNRANAGFNYKGGIDRVKPGKYAQDEGRTKQSEIEVPTQDFYLWGATGHAVALLQVGTSCWVYDPSFRRAGIEVKNFTIPATDGTEVSYAKNSPFIADYFLTSFPWLRGNIMVNHDISGTGNNVPGTVYLVPSTDFALGKPGKLYFKWNAV